jgi:hypothetical protein
MSFPVGHFNSSQHPPCLSDQACRRRAGRDLPAPRHWSPRPAKRTGAAAARRRWPICFNSAEDGMRDEIQSEADRRWQSECESGGNRKADDDTLVLVPA